MKLKKYLNIQNAKKPFSLSDLINPLAQCCDKNKVYKISN